jgi:hypothetical protein
MVPRNRPHRWDERCTSAWVLAHVERGGADAGTASSASFLAFFLIALDRMRAIGMTFVFSAAATSNWRRIGG